MPTDLLTELRISFNDLSKELDVSVSTVWRWTVRGIRGHRLESFSLGGRRFTTRAAFTRFLIATNRGRIESGETSRQRERRIEQAEGRADELGI